MSSFKLLSQINKHQSTITIVLVFTIHVTISIEIIIILSETVKAVNNPLNKLTNDVRVDLFDE